ncbi:MAG TPA: phospho-N-acetylmuramoyl-pentapeptide-transferase [Myxococcales bacterium]|nr:phospho-N-acetylmuramoyl-pentapeptide-transferase [Deltaproteobacteria bacterium]HAA53985.1 phospho-N-acetylmuramoyl-pentapeptide-transferase [Myxococcales bacterium]
MLYHLSETLMQYSSAARLVRYTTFRTIVAMLTSFLISLLIGRYVINFLYRRKIRDVVRDYSVMSVDSKRGTPTMGGILMLISISCSIILWGNFHSPFLYYLLFAMVWFGAVGGYDDYMKLRHQDSDKGLSRGAKYLSQIGYGLIFGILFLHPVTTPLPHPAQEATCKSRWNGSCPRLCKTDSDCQKRACGVKNAACINNTCQALACTEKKTKEPVVCQNNGQCTDACGRGATCHKPWMVQLSNHDVVVFRPSQLYVPFLKYHIIDLSWLYVLVIIFMIVYAANAVNFADGLDGLTIVPTIFSFAVYGIYAYIFGNAILSNYLWFPMLPGAGESAVFCGAVVGAGVGFLWFNAYPAEVFMGDTGSIALGGVLGTLMVLLKQEVLFFLVGGIFLAEIASVALQDYLGIRILGKRIFFRAPIHHTYQHRGLAEPKIAIRFWIISGILALLALAALKIR